MRNLRSTGRRTKWMMMNERQDKNKYWADDDIEFLPRVGKPGSLTHTLLLEAGINTIGDLAQLADANLPPIRNIKGLHTAARHAQPGSCPNPAGTDHRNASNPYESKFGESWEEEIRKSAALKPFRPISDLVEFMVEEEERVMANTAHEGDWFFITTHFHYSLPRNAGSIWKVRVLTVKGRMIGG